jgi:undecaprenyl-phosphate galactose phosphotransferase
MKFSGQRINRWKNRAEMVTTFVIDVTIILVIFYLSAFVRTDLLPLIYPGFPLEIPFRSFVNIWWIFLVWIFFCYYEGLYSKRFSFWDEIKSLWKVSFFSTVGIFTIVSIGKLGGDISRTVIVLMGVFSIILFPVIRINV